MQAGYLVALQLPYLQGAVINMLEIFMHPSGVHCRISGFLYFSLLIYSELKL